jgi:hypothetical protein
MPKNEDGEFELLVGNKQLLSIVFIVMVLFGIVFSMGYFVGRNSAPEAAVASKPATTETAVAQRPSSSEGTTPPPTPAASEPAQAAAPLEPGQAQVSGSETVPVGGEVAKTAAPAQAPATAPPAQPASLRAPEGVKAAAGQPSRPTTGPQPGQTYLQVAAVNRPEAELVVDVLKRKTFPAMVANGPSPTLFRVLVGPVTDGASLGKMKADLEAAGFKSITKRY